MPDRYSTSASLARQGRLIRKELMEILRDRRTIVTLVLMPILIYPLLGVGFMQFFRAVAPSQDPKFVVGSEDPRALNLFLGMEKTFGPRLKALMRDDVKPPVWEVAHVRSVDDVLRAGGIDIALSLDTENDKPPRVLAFQATYLRTSPNAATAALWLERLVALANGQSLEELLSRPNAPPGARILLRRNVLASAEGDGMISLTAVIPFILILMTITGAVYPAIDLTAGERERGTLEILVAAPVPRINLLIAKYAAVVFVAVLTAMVNLGAMATTVLLNPLGKTRLGPGVVSLGLLGQMFGLLLLFACFFSALLLTITSFARSFKEAQAYLIPLMLFSMAPGAVGMIPGITLTPGLAVVPLVNIVLLGRDLLDGKAQAGTVVLVIVATLLYAAAALSLAARVFGAEGVLYNERNSWSDLLRRPATTQPAASPNSALWSLALMVPIFFVGEAMIRAWLPATPAGMILGMTLLCGVLFLALPAIFAWQGRVAAGTGFGLLRPRLISVGAAILLGVSLWALLLPVLAWLQPEGPAGMDESREKIVQAFRQQSTGLRVALVLALVVQAVLEELFFRGFLWAAFARKASVLWTILATSVLFSLAHVVMGGMLGIERLLPALLPALVLGFLRARSGSVVPGMVMHALHNAILGYLGQSGLAAGMESLPWPWLALASVGFAAGIGLALVRKRDDIAIPHSV